jgi:hypothetical protein
MVYAVKQVVSKTQNTLVLILSSHFLIDETAKPGHPQYYTAPKPYIAKLQMKHEYNCMNASTKFTVTETTFLSF